MIDQSVISPGKWTTAPGHRGVSHVEAGVAEVLAPARPAAVPVKSLLRFLFILAIACALTCVYIWQMSQVAAIKLETTKLERKVTQLEQENVALMLQVAQQQSPAAVDREARALGMTPAKQVVHVVVAPQGAVIKQVTQQTTERESSALAAIWQRLIRPLAN